MNKPWLRPKTNHPFKTNLIQFIKYFFAAPKNFQQDWPIYNLNGLKVAENISRPKNREYTRRTQRIFSSILGRDLSIELQGLIQLKGWTQLQAKFQHGG